MISLLRHEFFKLFRNRAVQIVFIIAVLLSIGMTILMLFIPEELLGGALSGSGSIGIAAEGSEVWLILCAVIVSSIVVTEYNRGQIRNMVMSGHSRIKIFFAKYIVCLVSAVALFTVIVLVGLPITTIANGWGDDATVLQFIGMFFHVLLQYAAVTALILFIADLTRSTGAALGANIGLILIFIIIGSLGVRVEIDGEVIVAGNRVLEFIGDLYVGVLAMRVATPDLTAIKIIQYIATAVVTTAIALIGGAFLFKRRDLK